MNRAWLTTCECAAQLGELYAEMLRREGYDGDLDGVRGVYDSRYIRHAIDAGELEPVHLPQGNKSRRTLRILKHDFDVYVAHCHPRVSALRRAS